VNNPKKPKNSKRAFPPPNKPKAQKDNFQREESPPGDNALGHLNLGAMDQNVPPSWRNQLSEYFADPRFRSERLFLVFGLPAILAGLIAIALLLYSGQNSTIGENTETPPEVRTENVTEIAPTSFQLAEIAMKENRLDDAGILLEKSISEAENVEQSLSLLGILFKQQGRYPEAISIFDKAIQLQPKAEQYFYRAECHLALGNNDQAFADLSAAVDASPSQALFTNKRYLFMIGNGRKQEVTDAINIRVRSGVESDRNSWVMAAAAIALEQGEPATAAVILKGAINLLPEGDFKNLLQDPVFKPYRSNPHIMPFFVNNATLPAKK